ncbi:hypothetical protein C8Q79DRAFT_1118681 [Trametes meyenii]|nr:hypothetical protein C8Q79DRAFT_1118681 [Trametes meyenii]
MAVVPKPEPQDVSLPPAPAPAPTVPQQVQKSKPNSKPAAPATTRDAALKEISEYRRVTAWSIHRWPLEKRIVHERTRVHLPRTYRARHGADVRTIYPDTDINQFVHAHYAEVVPAEREGVKTEESGKGALKKAPAGAQGEWPNYVASEGVLARRHEFLGPDPRVAGFWVDAAGEYHVKWYDAFLGDQWIDDRKWSFDVRPGARGDWVEADDVDP